MSILTLRGKAAWSFPRMRGDGPNNVTVNISGFMFPPHARGWMVDPCAGMDPRGRLPLNCRSRFPRMRGDGPLPGTPTVVSPACAGMDPCLARQQLPPSRFPRMRGDGPFTTDAGDTVTGFPPHARGWTLHDRRRRHGYRVSPACAGMDPSPTLSSCTRSRRPELSSSKSLSRNFL